MADRTASKRYPGVYYRESTVKRHKGKPDRIYWVTYRSARGKQLWDRIGSASEGVTEEYASRKRIEKVNLVNHGGMPNARRRRAATLSEVFEAYVESLRLDGKHTAPEQSRFDNHLAPAFGGLTLEELTDDSMAKHKAALLVSLAPGSVKHIFALLRRVVNFGVRKKLWRGVNPVGPQSDFSMPLVQNAGERFLTPAEAGALLNELAKRSPMVRDMAFVALKTGLRATEVFGIRGKDLDPVTGTLYVDAKGGKRHAVYAGPEVMSVLLAYDKPPGELIFQRRYGGRIPRVHDVFGRAVDAVGLNDGVEDKRRKVWFHVLRHTFISWLAQSGDFTLLELKEAARHDRIESTMRYAHLIPGGVRDKLARR